jgi:homoserine O-acetyltransferase/O-succinyltransferase
MTHAPAALREIHWLRPGVGAVAIADSSRPFNLERGGSLRRATIAVETWGEPNANASNAVLICPCLTADAYATRRDADDRPGWWESLVGPDQALDPVRHFIGCAAVLGGCGGSTGPPTLDPEAGIPLGRDFPAITIGDIVRTQALVLDALRISTPVTVIGGSIGGFQAPQWVRAFPRRVAQAIVMAAGPRLSPFGLAFNAIARHAIEFDATSNGQRGLALARQIGHLTYRSAEAFERRFPRDHADPAAGVASYLHARGESFIRRFDADAYLRLIDAMDRFDIGPDLDQLRSNLSTFEATLTLIGIASDWLFTLRPSRSLKRRRQRASPARATLSPARKGTTPSCSPTQSLRRSSPALWRLSALTWSRLDPANRRSPSDGTHTPSDGVRRARRGGSAGHRARGSTAVFPRCGGCR